MMDEANYWLWFNQIKGIGLKMRHTLMKQGISPRCLFEATEHELHQWLKPSQAEQVLVSKDEDKIKNQLEELNKKKIKFIYPGHSKYPKSLYQLYDAPTGLYYKGCLPAKTQRSIAIIGARQADYYGIEMAHYFARELAKRGVAIISGLAYGVDGAAHKGALDADGYTLGILGCGVNICYPKENYKLYEQMEQTGGIMSEYGVGTSPYPGLFPLRNRLIAAMSSGILVTQARAQSGTLITVDQGLELGRDIFSVPGRIGDDLSVGCNHLIRSGAKVVTCIDDILEEWGIEGEKEEFQMHRTKGLTKLELRVYENLQMEPKYIDSIIEETRLLIGELLPILLHLERKGLVKQPRQNYYCVVL